MSTLITARTTLNAWPLARQLVIVLALLNFVDFYTTKSLVDAFGFEIEANPWLYKLIVTTGTVWAIFWAKAAFFVWLGWANERSLRKKQSSGDACVIESAIFIAVMAYFGIMCWNLFLCTNALILPMP